MCLLRGEVERMNFPGDDGNAEDGDRNVEDGNRNMEDSDRNVEDGDTGNKSDESEEYFPEESWLI